MLGTEVSAEVLGDVTPDGSLDVIDAELDDKKLFQDGKGFWAKSRNSYIAIYSGKRKEFAVGSGKRHQELDLETKIARRRCQQKRALHYAESGEVIP